MNTPLLPENHILQTKISRLLKIFDNNYLDFCYFVEKNVYFCDKI